MADRSLIAKIINELDRIKSRYRNKYGAVIFDVTANKINDIIVLDGMVLSQKQKNEVFLAVKEIIKNNKIENKIKVLSDPGDKLGIGWGVAISDISDVWAKLRGEKNIIGVSRANQARKGDFVRILAKKGVWLLVQTRDLAIGWINSSQLTISLWKIVEQEWIKTKRAMPGKVIKKRLAKNTQNKFFSFLKKYLNVVYLLGGTTDKGIDCSGLTQKFYLDIFGILLPRHSGDQALCGEEVDLSDAHFGDLVYLRNRSSKQAHIGVVVEKFEMSEMKRKNFDNILILNARLENDKAAIEDLSGILKKYNLILIKRIINDI